MRILMLAVFILAVSQQDRVEARDLGICNGLNFKACAEALFRSEKSYWVNLCSEYDVDSPKQCLAEMVACISAHSPEVMSKYKDEQSVLQGQNSNQNDIVTGIEACFLFDL